MTSERGSGSEMEGSDQDEGQRILPPRKAARRRQFRFNQVKDLTLVAEVSNLKPFLMNGAEESRCWKDIAKILGNRYQASLSSRCVKQRFQKLRKEFKREDFLTRYKTGTEEEFSQLKQALSDLDNLITDQEVLVLEASQAQSKKLDKEKAAAQEIRDAALSGCLTKRKDSDDGTPRREPPTKRSTESTLLQAWRDKQDEDRKAELEKAEKEDRQKNLDRDLRKEELQLERDRLELEKEKHALDRELQIQRFELEKQERLAQVKTQEAILQLLSKMSK